jgi:endonuclease/exonuclease/phosphatase (EEP) superfamily protein YafD
LATGREPDHRPYPEEAAPAAISKNVTRPRSLLRGLLAGLLRLGSLPVVLGSVAALAGPLHWAPLLATHFRPHLAVAALGLLLFALLLRLRWSALTLALCLLASAWPVAVAWRAKAPVQQDSDAPLVRVATWNLYYHNDRAPGLAPALLALDADILVLTEVLPRHAPLIQALAAAYPYRALPGAEGGQGEALFSRLPLGAALRRRASDSASLWIVEVALPGGPATLLIGHPLPATGGRLDGVHAAWFDTAEQELAALPAGARALVIGDLNATPWSPRLARLLAAGDLRWTGDGLGSWPVTLPRWLGLPIDHILIPAGVTVQSWEARALPGSDHRAVIALLRLPYP